LEHDLFGKPASTHRVKARGQAFPDHALGSVEKVMEVVEANDADEDQIDGNDVVEEPRHDEDQDAGDKCDQRRNVGRRDDHDLNLLVDLFGWDECDADTGKARQLYNAGTWRPVLAGFANFGTVVP
jgi:hypothetical protein